MNNQVSARWGIVAIVVLVVAMSRLIPHAIASSLFNFSPLGGIALFGAAYFKNKYLSYLLPLAALWVSNLLIVWCVLDCIRNRRAMMCMFTTVTSTSHFSALLTFLCSSHDAWYK